LRRTAAYRAAVVSAAPARPAAFGIYQFLDPSTGVPDARPMWLGDASAYVLRCHAKPAGQGRDVFDLRSLGPIASLADGGGTEHLLLSDGLASIRLDIVSGTLRPEPVTLCYELEGIDAALAPLLTLRRFLALARTGNCSKLLHPPERRAARFVRELRVHDAMTAGASQRDMAIALFGRPCEPAGWRTHVPSLRLQVQRLVRRARLMADGGYRDLLRPPA